MNLKVCLALLSCLMLTAAPAHAHRMKIFAAQDGKDISGRVYFSGGGKGAGLDVHVRIDGTGSGGVKTDSEGRFVFTPEREGAYEFSVESGDGHAAQAQVEINCGGKGEAKSEASLKSEAKRKPPQGMEELIAKEISRQVLPLREQLDRYEAQTRFRDIVGGIGWIVGIAGVAAWIMSRRKGGA